VLVLQLRNINNFKKENYESRNDLTNQGVLLAIKFLQCYIFFLKTSVYGHFFLKKYNTFPIHIIEKGQHALHIHIFILYFLYHI